jgi:hypothetical protein
MTNPQPCCWSKERCGCRRPAGSCATKWLGADWPSQSPSVSAPPHARPAAQSDAGSSGRVGWRNPRGRLRGPRKRGMSMDNREMVAGAARMWIDSLSWDGNRRRRDDDRRVGRPCVIHCAAVTQRSLGAVPANVGRSSLPSTSKHEGADAVPTRGPSCVQTSTHTNAGASPGTNRPPRPGCHPGIGQRRRRPPPE